MFTADVRLAQRFTAEKCPLRNQLRGNYKVPGDGRVKYFSKKPKEIYKNFTGLASWVDYADTALRGAAKGFDQV